VAVPKRRTTSSRRDIRRAQHDRITAPNLIPCPNCSAPTQSHHVCPECGHYKGREIISKKTAEEPTS
jgi:large subunit ribosomal protein L32